MSSELGSNNANEELASQEEYASPEDTSPVTRSVTNSQDVVRDVRDLKRYSIPAYLLEDDPIEDESVNNASASKPIVENSSGFYAPRPILSRGFQITGYDSPSVPFVNQSPTRFGTSVSIENQSAPSSRWSWLFPGRKKNQLAPQPDAPLTQSTAGQPPHPSAGHANRLAISADGTVPAVDPQTGLETVSVPAPVSAPAIAPPKIWEKQPYRTIAYISALSGTLVGAWLLGILAARIAPGTIERAPLQESVLRKSGRLASGLWHLPRLWRTSTAETRVEAIPIPETGPIIDSVSLSPIERQPLIDELNAVETELLSLDRRIQTLEKQLGKPPYQGAGIEPRIDGLRDAIDPPARKAVEPSYEPAVRDPQVALLSVAEHKITLPSDALFAPGDRAIKDSDLLNQVLDQLINYPGATVVIRSYSDDQAEASAARKYTLAQATELSDFLARSLPEGYRWVAIGGGRAQPVEPNDSEPNRQRNRRIEILIDSR